MKLAQIDFNTIYNTLNFQGDINVNSSLSIGDIIYELFPYIYAIAGILLLFYLIAGGFELLVSAGEQGRVQSGKSKITNALVGFLILFFSYWIVQIVGEVLNLSLVRSIF